MAERPEDLNLPNSIVSRIIKESLPDGVNVSKEAKIAIAKAASVFVLYATSCSNNIAMKANRKTISGPDVLSAMSDMEFERFVEPLKAAVEGMQHSNLNCAFNVKKSVHLNSLQKESEGEKRSLS